MVATYGSADVTNLLSLVGLRRMKSGASLRYLFDVEGTAKSFHVGMPSIRKCVTLAKLAIARSNARSSHIRGPQKMTLPGRGPSVRPARDAPAHIVPAGPRYANRRLVMVAPVSKSAEFEEMLEGRLALTSFHRKVRPPGIKCRRWGRTIWHAVLKRLRPGLRAMNVGNLVRLCMNRYRHR